MTQQKQGPLSVKISTIKSARETTANIWAQGQPTSCILPVAGGGGEGAANFPWYGLSSQTCEWVCADLELSSAPTELLWETPYLAFK